MTRDHERGLVRAIIANHVGSELAIPITGISAATGLSAREVKQHVHDLRMEGVRIGSLRSAHPGYYMIASLAQWQEFATSYMRQAVSELSVLRAMAGRDAAWLKELEGQMTLVNP